MACLYGVRGERKRGDGGNELSFIYFLTCACRQCGTLHVALLIPLGGDCPLHAKDFTLNKQVGYPLTIVIFWCTRHGLYTPTGRPARVAKSTRGYWDERMSDAHAYRRK